MDPKEIIGITAAIIGLIGYFPYIRDILRGKTRPHIFSWLIWAILTGEGGLAMWAGNAGPGIYVSVITFILCTFVLILSLKVGKRDVTFVDWVFLTLSLLGFIPWYFTKSPDATLVIVIIIDFLALIPTFRKTWKDPTSETLATWVVNTFKHLFSIFAMNEYSFTTLAYPIYLISGNIIVVSMILIRKSTLLSRR